MLLVELVFEPAEGSLAPDRTCQPAPGTFIGYPIGEVGHVLVPDPGRQRVDDDQVQLVQADRRLAVDAGVGRPERDLSRVRVDQPAVFVVGLAGQRLRSPPDRCCSGPAIQHPARISLSLRPRSRTGTRRQRQKRTFTPIAPMHNHASSGAIGVGTAVLIAGPELRSRARWDVVNKP
jgi:hypothetical protein